MNYVGLLKRAFHITWRYRPLWIFGFFLALCSGGGGGGGGGNIRIPGADGGSLGELPSIPEISPYLIITLIVALFCLVILLSVIGLVVRAVTRTALIGMVRQVQQTEAVTMAEGWHLGWSARAWRLFLVSLVIGIPVAVFSILLLLMALSPLLLLIADSTALKVIGIVVTILAVLFVILILVLINAVISPFEELAWRRTVLDRPEIVESLRDAFGLIRRRLKDVVIVWLLMFGVGIGWGIVSLVVVLPVSLVAAVLVGGVPAGLVYLISRSGWGAAIAGVPLAVLVLVLVGSVANGFYLIYRSAVWTLTYLEIQGTEDRGQEPEKPLLSDAQPEPQPEQ